MIEALYNLGKFIVEQEDLDKIDVFQDTAKLTNRTKTVLTINLRKINEKFVYEDIVEEQLRQKDTNKYLYKGGTPNGVDYAPSSLITNKASSTFKNRVLKWFNSHKDPELLDRIFDGLNKSKDQIILDLEEKFNSINKKDRINVLLTITIQEKFEKKYVGDYQIFSQKNLFSVTTI